jgi:hypothetical protein
VWLRNEAEEPCTEAGLVDVAMRSLTELPAPAASWRGGSPRT